MSIEMMTQEEARELFDYNPETGELRYRAGRNAGSIAGMVSKNGYQVVWSKGGRKSRKLLYVHRLVWLLSYGEWPTRIDHINMDKSDNRLSNLRLATRSQNLANQRVRARTGFKGVWRHGPSWAASIRKDNVTHHLGTFQTPELAHAAYCKAAESMYGDFARSE